MGGGFEFPVKYGYSVVAQSSEGRKYHLMHPHQDWIAVNSDSITEIPVDLPDSRASLISNMETALTACWDGNAHPDETILIVGFGLIGSLIAGVLKCNGCMNICIDEPHAPRANLAQKLGFKVNTPDSPPQEYHLAFHCSATSEGLQSCIDKMEFEGRIIEVSWYGNRTSKINFGEGFHYNRLTIQSSQVSTIPGKMRDIWDFRKRKSEVMRILCDPYWDQYNIPIIPFDQSPELFEKIRRNELEELSYILKY